MTPLSHGPHASRPFHTIPTCSAMRLPASSSLVLFFLLLATFDAQAKPVTVPINLRYPTVEKILIDQLFTGPNQTAVVFSDRWNCNTLTLVEPKISGTDDGQLRLNASLTARGGTPVGNQCVPLFSWDGTFNASQTAYIADDGTRLRFKISDSSITDPQGGKANVPSVLWDWVKTYVHPELERFNVDLAPVLLSTRDILNTSLPGAGNYATAILESLAFRQISASSDRLEVDLGLELPDAPLSSDNLNTDIFSGMELGEWDATWQSWDAFVTWLLKDLAADTNSQDTELAGAIATVFLEARYDLREALVINGRNEDPVRDLFVKTWNRLTPLLQRELEVSAELDALKYLSFISAADALIAVDGAAENFDMKFDSETWRGLARLLKPTISAAELQYGDTVDPELRKLLNLDPDFSQSTFENRPTTFPLAILIPRAYADVNEQEVVKKLTLWVPKNNELDTYLTLIGQLLTDVSDHEINNKKIPQRFRKIYENLVLATAWQESCWRQYASQKGKITPLRSPAGSVGLMQVNLHVWRGVYDAGSLQDNIGYNARAGNEILVHYLVDYAIKKREHEVSGGDENLARSAYAMYNGGPGQLSRYRSKNASKNLRKIDDGFWKKYRALEAQGEKAVKSCYR